MSAAPTLIAPERGVARRPAPAGPPPEPAAGGRRPQRPHRARDPFLAPFVFIVLTALMTDRPGAVVEACGRTRSGWRNFVDVFSTGAALRYAGNTFLYARLATIGVLVSSVPVAYALARLRWRGRDVVFLLVLATMMLPAQVTSCRCTCMFAKLHLVGSLTPLILPNWFGDAFSIFLLRQFFLTIPEEYADAARVDGCGEIRIMRHGRRAAGAPRDRGRRAVLVPLRWNDFFGPLLYTGENEQHWTLSVGLAQFRTLLPGAVEPHDGRDAPVHGCRSSLLFFAAQKAFVEGVTLTGVKG